VFEVFPQPLFTKLSTAGVEKYIKASVALYYRDIDKMVSVEVIRETKKKRNNRQKKPGVWGEHLDKTIRSKT
jgi:hypothetical protein